MVLMDCHMVLCYLDVTVGTKLGEEVQDFEFKLSCANLLQDIPSKGRHPQTKLLDVSPCPLLISHREFCHSNVPKALDPNTAC